MPTLKQINKEKHTQHGWKLRRSMIAARKDTVVPISISEVTKLLPAYAFAFVKDAQGKFVFVAIQGIYKEENLYVSDAGEPFFTPTPRHYHAYPFFLHEFEAEGKLQATLLFDHDSGLYREDPQVDKGEKRFMNDEGQIDADVEKVLVYLTESEKWRKITQSAVDALDEAGVLEAWEPKIENPDPKRNLLKGFYKINLEKLNVLEGEDLKNIQKSQGFTVAYAQLFSMYRVETLNKLHALKMKQNEAPMKEMKKHNIDNVDAFFKDTEDEISFDWSKL